MPIKTLKEIEELKIATTEGTCWKEDGVCKECSDKPLCNAVQSLVDTCLEYRKMLEKLQYVENSGKIMGAIYKFCPICGQPHVSPHTKNCELAKLLK